MKINKGRKLSVTLMTLFIVCLSFMGVTVSYFMDEIDSSVNTSVSGDVDISIAQEPEYKDNVLIKNAKIRNEGTDKNDNFSDVYVRAKIVPVRRDKNGSVLGKENYDETSGRFTYEASDGTLIEIIIKDHENWLFKDGTFYCTQLISPGEEADFVDKVSVLVDGVASEMIYDLEVQVLAEGIGADAEINGMPAVEYAWKDVVIGSDGVSLMLRH